MRHLGKVLRGAIAVLGAAACVFLVVAVVGQGVVAASLWAGVVAAIAGVVATVAALWPLAAAPPRVLLSPGLEVPEWVVGRPAEAAQVVAALLADREGTVGITTGLYGAGGFGKSTLARVVCADGQVRRRFRGGICLVTLGRDVRGSAAVAAKVNDVIKLVAGEEATFTDPELAGRRLGAVLDARPRRLLVIDDVWEPGQLAPFTVAGRRCARLVTTRIPGLLSRRDAAVRVDQMSVEQARRLLLAGLPSLDRQVIDGLLTVTGRWPLLLRLVNKILANAAVSGADLGASGARLLEQLRAGGPAVVDELLADGRELDVGEPAERAQAVRATIEASTSLLRSQDRQRFTELGVFAEDEVIPFELIARLWRATAGLEELEASQLCARLAVLALISVSPTGSEAGGVTLHDVVRDFLRAELGARHLVKLNEVLLEGAAARLPAATGLDTQFSAARVAWWELGPADRYLQDHLIGHLLEAGRRAEAESVATDLRWAGFRVREAGPAAPAADLSQVGTLRAARLLAALARTAHLLAPANPSRAVVDVLHARLASDPDWGPQVAALRNSCQRPRLVGRWPLPDLADPALRHVLTGHDGQINTIAAGPDGSWLATGSSDGTVRIWDLATGQDRIVLRGHRGRVSAVIAGPDGNWLASAGARDNRVRIWDAGTGNLRTVLGSRGVILLAVGPDDGRLVTRSTRDKRLRVWDAQTGKEQASFDTGWATAMAVAPDGGRLVTGRTSESRLRVWDTQTGKEQASFDTGAGRVASVAFAPDGTWVVAGCTDRTLRIWDMATGKEKAVLTGHAGLVVAVVAAPDGTWIAGGVSDGTVRIWEVATGNQRAIFADPVRQVIAVAIAPDGKWLAAGYSDGIARIWDVHLEREQPARPPHTSSVDTVAALRDGSGLVTGGLNPRVRIWDTATGTIRATLTGHEFPVAAIAVAPDGTWLASVGEDPVLRTWDTATGTGKTAIPSGHGIWTGAVAIAPDGTWIATGGYDRMVRLWDAATGNLRAAFGAYRTATNTMTVESDGASSEMVTTGYDRFLELCMKAITRRGRRASHPRNCSAAYTIAIAPDCAWLAAAGHGPVIQVWDTMTGRQRFVLEGHRSEVYAAAVAPDGSWLVTCGDDGTIRIWDMATGQQQAALPGHQGEVYTAAITPDGRWLATGGSDQTLRVWETACWQPQAFMRVENPIYSCAWLSPGMLACAGPAGLYLFDFLTTDTPAVPSDAPVNGLGPVR